MNLRKFIGDEKQEIIKILNQGFNIDGVVPRCVGQTNKIKKFRSFSPKIMGGISDIDDVLFERCIKYTTKRIKDVKITKYRETKKVKDTLNKLVDDLYIFGFIYAPIIKKIYDNFEVSFEGNSLREDDLWNPLLCIAKVIDEENNNSEVTDSLMKYANKLSKDKYERQIENEPKIQLLFALYEYLERTIKFSIELKYGRKAFEVGDIYNYASNNTNIGISSKITFGKKLKEWYGFEKIRKVSDSGGQKVVNQRLTYYIFNKEDILKIMKDNNIKLEDYEWTS